MDQPLCLLEREHPICQILHLMSRAGLFGLAGPGSVAGVGRTMSSARWLGIGLVVTLVMAGAVSFAPSTARILQSQSGTSAVGVSSAQSQPSWNTGNLCNALTYGPGPGDVTCLSYVSHSPYPLWYNFSAGSVTGGTVNVTILGSDECIYLNFHSFFTTINIHLVGSGYACPSHPRDARGNSGSYLSTGGVGDWHHEQSGCHIRSWDSGDTELAFAWGHGGGKKRCAPGVNIVVNSEGDTLRLVQCGRYYVTNVTVYGTTTLVNATQSWHSRGLNTTITYIGTKPGFAVCPSGITDFRVTWSELSYGSRNTFNTIFVDGTNVAHPPPNHPYSTQPMLPPDGTSYGRGNLYGYETTQTPPFGSCHYLRA
jgi:hypothetical protein